MSELEKIIGAYDYEQLISDTHYLRGVHDEAWSVDDKAAINWYTADEELIINATLRDSAPEDLILNVTNNKEIKLANFITLSLDKVKSKEYRTVYRWENDSNQSLCEASVGDYVLYKSFISTSIDSSFTFNDSKTKRIIINSSDGAYIAQYSKYRHEEELLIDKYSVFQVEQADHSKHTYVLRYVSNDEQIQS